MTLIRKYLEMEIFLIIYRSTSLGYNKLLSMTDSDKVLHQELLSVLNNVLPDVQIFDYVMSLLASCIYGGNREQNYSLY